MLNKFIALISQNPWLLPQKSKVLRPPAVQKGIDQFAISRAQPPSSPPLSEGGATGATLARF